MSDSQVDPGRYRALQIDRVGAVLRVTIDHPESPLNAVDGLLHDEFTRLFADLKRESVARCVLLTGAGRAFSAGGDFNWFPTLDNLARLEHLRRDAKQMIWDLLDVPPEPGYLPPSLPPKPALKTPSPRPTTAFTAAKAILTA